MKTLLRIDSSLRTEGSYSRSLGDFFIDEWKKRNPANKIKCRDFSKNTINHLDQATVDCFYDESTQTDLLKRSDELIAELFDADEMLITVPMYNFGIPSSLKAYFDLVVRTEKTFRYEDKVIGLLKNKKAYIVSSMGDAKTDTKSLVEVHLQCILNYIGISEIYFFCIDGTSEEGLATGKIESQKKSITNLLNQ
jgi:FMN-dependent NADH-azoreductase